MRKIISTFINHSFYANLIIGVFVLGGLYSVLQLNRSFFPERKSRDIIVAVFYPGASPKEMEEGITSRIEESVRSIVGIKEINSNSSENFTNVVITTTGKYDIDVTVQEVKNAIDGISSFPSAAERPIVYKRRNTTPALFMGLYGKDVNLLDLKKYAMDIEDDLRASGLITQINLSGYPDLEISVEIKEEELQRYQLTIDELANAIRMNNMDVSAGVLRSTDEEILIRSRQRSIDANKIGDIIVRGKPDGSYIRIRDVADVKMKFSDTPNYTLMNEHRSVFIQVSKLNEEDLTDITEFCNEYTEKFNAANHKVKLEVTFNFNKLLKGRLDLLKKNGFIGLILVLISLGLFLNLRLSLWVAFGIPVSFLGMFIIANFLNVTVNMISLFGMILVIGILVDDGIVIAENIYAHYEKGKSPKRAAIDGTMEVLPAVTTSVTTTIVAFSPLILVREGGMEFMYEMAVVVIFSLTFSLMEAYFVLPGHVGKEYVLRKVANENKDKKTFREKIDSRFDFIRLKIYGRLLKKIVYWRWAFMALPIGLIILTAGMFGGNIIKSTLFPPIPFEFFRVEIAFTPGSGEKQTFKYLSYLEDKVWELNDELVKDRQIEEPDDTIPFITYTFLTVGNAFNGVENGAHAGHIFVQLRDLEGTGLNSFQIVERLQKKVGDIPEAEKMIIGGSNRFGKPVSLSLLSKNAAELKKAENFLIEELNNMEELNNIINTNAEGKREVQLKLKSKAFLLGLNEGEVARQIRQGFFGEQAQRLQQGKDEVRIWVRYPKTGRMNIGQLENMKIKTPAGNYMFSEIVDYKIERGPVNIKRYNMMRESRIEADLTDALAPTQPVMEKIDNNILPELARLCPGVKVEKQGQAKAGAESRNEMMRYFIIAFIIMLVIIMIHFRSFSQAIIVVFMIPLAWMGAAWGHGVEGLPVSMLSSWGMVALSGVIINDAVVFLAKYNLNLKDGMKVFDAVIDAGVSRFRPVLLTTITTSLGLYPLIYEKSFQAKFLQPMAISLAYGVFIGTIFLLIFFPAIILALNDMKVWLKWLWTGVKPSKESVEKAVIYSNKQNEL